jgi:hypothetical protein
MAVIDVLEANTEHLSHNQILAEGQKIHSNLSRTTVYRTMELLVELRSKSLTRTPSASWRGNLRRVMIFKFKTTCLSFRGCAGNVVKSDGIFFWLQMRIFLI